MNIRRMREYLAIVLVAALPAGAAVTVSFPSSHYSDIGPPGAESEEVKQELARHLQALGARYLAADQNLRVDVLDVDLAGEREIVGVRDIRIARGRADFPRLTLRYALETPGGTRSGEESISNSSYLWFPARSRSEEKLYHEKRLLESWFRDRFAR